MAKTRLQGFMNGANQIANFMQGEIITQKQYLKAKDMIKKKAETLENESDENYKENKRQVYKYREDELAKRLKMSYDYVAFMNYAKQMHTFYQRKDQGITQDEIEQLAANNRAVRKLKFHAAKSLKYDREGSNAIKKFKELILDNDYKKLQYLKSLPYHTLHKIDIAKINDISLPKDGIATEQIYDDLQKQIEELQKRLEKLDANRHINSSEFKKMKVALKEMTEALKNPWDELDERDHYIIGEKLEAVQEASMNYVQAKGVGRQSSPLGKGRMELGLDIADISARFMGKFASEKRLNEVKQFEDILEASGNTKNGIRNYVRNEFNPSIKANIFKDEERGIDALGNGPAQAAEEQEIKDNDDFEDEFYY